MVPPPPPPMPGPMAGPMTNPHGVQYMEANGGDRFVQPVSHSFIVTMNVINTITQLLLGGVVVVAIIMANITAELEDILPATFTSYTSLHIYLCVFGYVVLMSQAILTFNPHAGWANTLMHPQKTTIHWIMQIMGSILAIVGSIMKLIDDVPNFESAHGIIGVVAMGLTVISLISGVIHIIFPTQTKNKLYSTCHGSLGSFTITMAFLSLCFAFETQFRPAFGETNANVVITITVGAILGILTASLTRIFKRWDSD